MEEIEVWYSEYELGQFIDMALRWSIEGIYKDRTEVRPFSVFTNKVENARANYDKFCSQLNKKLTQNPNWKAIELDLNQKFLPMLNQYLQWYETNKKEFEKFQPYCPYTLMLTIIESTKQEIIKYFPEIANQYLNNMDSFEQLFTKAEIHGLIEQNKVSNELDYYRKKQSLAALRHNDLNMFSNEFSVWLQDIKDFAFKDQFEYLQFCKEETTFDLFVEFIHYRKAEAKKNIAENAQINAEINRYNEQQLIAMDILGLTTGENNFNPVKPVFYHIDKVLSKYKLSLKEALYYLNNHTGGLSDVNENLILKVKENIEYLIKIGYTKPPQQDETEAEQETIEMKPVLKPEAVQIVFDIIKDFFSPEQQTELKQVIETGNKANKKMLFKGNGNRLTDTFKKLFEHNFITGCQKQDLINWVILNFTFTHQNKVKAFIYDTVEKTISRNDNPCKSPLIEIKNGLIQKVEKPRTKNYNKY
jgi:hypothetical protein